MVLEKINTHFKKIFAWVFLLYLLLMLSLGRAFSILHIKTPLAPFFITEIILAIGLLLVLFHLKDIFNLPKFFISIFLLYFLYNFAYLVIALAHRSFFAFKDIPLSLYPLFLFVAYIIFSKKERLNYLYYILIISNILGIFFVRLLIFLAFPWQTLKYYLVVNMRVTNYGLYFCIALSFLFALYPILKSRISRFFVLLLISIDIYVLMLLNERSIWLALSVLFCYMFFALRQRFVKILYYLLPFIILIFIVLFYFDLKQMSEDRKDILILKARNFIPFITLFSEKGGIEENINPEFIKKARSISEETRAALNAQIKNDSKRPFNFNEDSYAERYKAFQEVVSASAGAGRSVRLLGITLYENECQDTIKGNLFWRLALWEQAFVFGMQSPFFGHGFGIYPNIRVWSHEYMNPIAVKSQLINTGLRPVHNYLLTIFYKTGTFGLSLFLIINVAIFFYGLKALRKCRDELARGILNGLLGGIICWHVLALLFDIIDSPPTNIFLWILGGIVISLYRSKDYRDLPQKN